MSLKCEWKLYLCVHHYLHQGLTHTSDHGYCQRCSPNYCCLHTRLYFDTFNTNWYILKKGSIVFHQQSFSVIVVTFIHTKVPLQMNNNGLYFFLRIVCNFHPLPPHNLISNLLKCFIHCAIDIQTQYSNIKETGVSSLCYTNIWLSSRKSQIFWENAI